MIYGWHTKYKYKILLNHCMRILTLNSPFTLCWPSCCICEIYVGAMYVWWWSVMSLTMITMYQCYLVLITSDTTGSWPGSPQLCFCYADIFIRHIISGREWLWLTNKTSSTTIIIEITRLLMSPFNDFNTQYLKQRFLLVIFRPLGTSSIHGWNMTWRLNQRCVIIFSCKHF